MRRILNLILLPIILLPAGSGAQPDYSLDLVQGFGRSNLELHAPEPTQFIIQSDNLMRKGRYEEAVMLLDYAIAENPLFADAYLKRGLLKYRMGREVEAGQDLARANQINPFISDLYGVNGPEGRLRLLAFDQEAWAHVHPLPEVLSHYYDWFFEEVLSRCGLAEEEPRGCEVRQAFIYALGLLGDGQVVAAETILLPAARDKRSALLVDLLGLAVFEQGKPKEALTYHLLAKELEPDLPMVHFNLGRTYLALDQPELAAESIEQALKIRPGFIPALQKRATLNTRAGNARQAMSDFDQMLENDRFRPRHALVGRAISKKMAGDLPGALNDLESVLQDEIGVDPDLLFLRGNVFLLMGEPLAAIEDYSSALQWGARRGEVFYNRGLAYLHRNMRSNGCVDLKRGVEEGYEEGLPVLQQFCSN